MEQAHPKGERTFVIIKPDGVQRGLVGEIIGRFERVGLKLVGMKIQVPEAEMVRKHYTLDPEWIRKVGEKSIEGYKKKGLTPPSEDPIALGNTVLEVLVKYLMSGPGVFMVLEGAHAAGIVRKLVGGTEPLSSDVGTIRGDFVLDSYQMADRDNRAIRNLIHASGSTEEAENEIKHWFKDEELIVYNILGEKILYDVNLDGILE